MNIKAGIIGGAGYTGGETLRVLLNHPNVAITFVHSSSNAGNPVWAVHTDLAGETELQFSSSFDAPADVVFLCLGHGDAKKFLAANSFPAATRIIDLSNDFRLQPNAVLGDRTFVYGLPELNKASIAAAQNIANPGCFATAIQLGLLPLAQAGLLGTVHTTGITGSTGAGQGLSATSHFSWRADNISAYKTLSHQHIGEIHQSLFLLQGNDDVQVHFVPWRGNFTRGIYASSVVNCDMDIDDVNKLYEDYYKNDPFTHLSSRMIDMKQVVNTNKCLLYLEKQDNMLAIHSTIDNLLKGAAGQAVQNMNLMFGLAEETGLRLKAAAF